MNGLRRIQNFLFNIEPLFEFPYVLGAFSQIVHHHQPINVPTAMAQTFLWITHKEMNCADWRVLTTSNATGTNSLTCLPKHGVTLSKLITMNFTILKTVPELLFNIKQKSRISLI
jgi:hypothetical protein